MANNEATIKKEILAEYLAIERTHLANERTLLAYLRSTLIGIATALTIFKLFETDSFMRITAFILGPSSMMISVFGLYRFIKIRRMLSRYQDALK
jgi:putative membrane protein